MTFAANPGDHLKAEACRRCLSWVPIRMERTKHHHDKAGGDTGYLIHLPAAKVGSTRGVRATRGPHGVAQDLRRLGDHLIGTVDARRLKFVARSVRRTV